MRVSSRASGGQARSHAIAYLARSRACISLSRAMSSGLRGGSVGSGATPFNKISALPANHPTTTAGVGHPLFSGNPQPEIFITRWRDRYGDPAGLQAHG